jgi:hypothetical protein
MVHLQLRSDPSWVRDANHDGPLTYRTSPGSSENVFQISYNVNRSGKMLEPPLDLMSMASAVAAKAGTLKTTNVGQCKYGHYVTARVENERMPHFQIWLISNGVHVITATHTCNVAPSAAELSAVTSVVESLELVPKPKPKPKWKFW